MKHFLIVVDMQKDFVDGALGTPEAVAIVPAVCDRIRSFEGEIIVTYDTHPDTYLATAEGKKLPVVHCVEDTDGWQLDTQVAVALAEKEYLAVKKPTFGSTDLPFAVPDHRADRPVHRHLRGIQRPAAQSPFPRDTHRGGGGSVRRCHPRDPRRRSHHYEDVPD